jgi:hypothetical protein
MAFFCERLLHVFAKVSLDVFIASRMVRHELFDVVNNSFEDNNLLFVFFPEVKDFLLRFEKSFLCHY